MPRDKKQDAFAAYIRRRFEGPSELDEDTAGEVFGRWSAVGLTDMLVAAAGEGGFSQKIILDYAPADLRDVEGGGGDDADPAAFDQFWALLLFFTARHKWTLLPGMLGFGKNTKKQRSRTTSSTSNAGDGDDDAEPVTVKGKVLAYAEKQGGQKRGLVKLLKEAGSVPELASRLSKKLGIEIGVPNLRLILRDLGIYAREVLG